MWPTFCPVAVAVAISSSSGSSNSLRLSQLVNFARNLLFYLRQVFCLSFAPSRLLHCVTNARNYLHFAYCRAFAREISAGIKRRHRPSPSTRSHSHSLSHFIPSCSRSSVCRRCHCGCHKTLLFALDRSCAAAITPSAIKLALHCTQSTTATTTATTARTATATTTATTTTATRQSENVCSIYDPY